MAETPTLDSIRPDGPRLPQATMDPRIGVLVRDGSTVFYAYVQGYETDPLQGSLIEIEQALGVPLTPPKIPPTPHLTADSPPALLASKIRRYAVRVIPDVVLFGSGQTFAEAIEHVYAASRGEAISEVRGKVREANGRHGQKFTYRARLDP